MTSPGTARHAAWPSLPERSRAEQSGAERSKKEQKGAKRNKKEQKGTKRNKKEQKGAGRSRKEQGGAGRSREEQHRRQRRSRSRRGAARPWRGGLEVLRELAGIPPPRRAVAGPDRDSATAINDRKQSEAKHNEASTSMIETRVRPPLNDLRPISVLRFCSSEGLTQAQFVVLWGAMFMFIGDFPEVVSQQIFAGTILVGRLGVCQPLPDEGYISRCHLKQPK